MIYMEPRHWEAIQDILNKYPYTFYAFGSRVKGTHKRFSDLDLCVKEPIPRRIIGKIDEEFEESKLPFKVEVLDWNLIAPRFQEIIKNDLIPLKLTENNAKNHH